MPIRPLSPKLQEAGRTGPATFRAWRGFYSSAIADRSVSGSTVRPSMSRIKTSPRAVRSNSSKSLSASTEVGVTMVSDPFLT